MLLDTSFSHLSLRKGNLNIFRLIKKKKKAQAFKVDAKDEFFSATIWYQIQYLNIHMAIMYGIVVTDALALFLR